MQAQEKNKGFTLLEVLVVMVLVGIISAMAYPEFSEWRKERELRDAAERIRNIFVNINTHVQRGMYGFAQVQIKPSVDETSFITRGMFVSNMAKNIFQNETNRNSITSRCKMQTGGGEGDYWDHDGEISERAEVINLSIKNIRVSVKSVSAVCFSKDAKWFSANGSLTDGSSIADTLYVCLGIKACEGPVKEDDGLGGGDTESDMLGGEAKEESEEEYIYAITWSRFGNIKLEKWNNNEKEWVSK